MDNETGRLAVRALNHWRHLYQPSYIGLRLLLQQFPDSSSSDFLQKYLLHKLPLRQIPRYRKFKKFKGFDPSREIQYRDMYAASPSTALAESYALQRLSKIPSLQNKSYVYSYRWPKTELSGGSYMYFYSGYSERNKKIADMLHENSNYHVIVNDIHDFYPSVNKDVVNSRLSNHLQQIKDRKLYNYVSAICEQILRVAETGIPIGPALAHVFGNIALEEIDINMYEILGDRYLRYVDDILMIVEPNEIERIAAKLSSLVESSGFELNKNKHDEVSSEDWLMNMPKPAEHLCAEQFDKLIQRLKLFLWWKPSKKFPLHNQFRDAGIPMPIQRFALNAIYGRFHHHMRTYINKTSQYLKLLTLIRLLNEDILFSDVSNLGNEFYETMRKIDTPESTDHPIIRKWRVQRIRYLLNRLLYLIPVSSYQQLLNIVPQIDEFYEHRCLIQAITEELLSPLFRVSGHAVSTFASICKELEYEPIKYDEEPPYSEATFDSICHSVTMGAIDPPDNCIENLSETNAELLKFCQFSGNESRVLKNHSFEDELRTLQLGVDEEVMQNIMQTRFSDVEQIDLDALLLAGYDS